MKIIKIASILLLSALLLNSCAVLEAANALANSSAGENSSSEAQSSNPTQSVNGPLTLYISPSVPQAWIIEGDNLELVDELSSADLVLSPTKPADGNETCANFQRIYAVGAPFPTVADGIRSDDLVSLWKGEAAAIADFSLLLMTEETKQVFTELWGDASETTVSVVSEGDLLDEVWNSSSALALLPFEDIEPRYKILNVDGINPLDRPMDVSQYSLTVTYSLTGKSGINEAYSDEIAEITADIPATNRDESKMTVVLMTGTTALARVTLRKIELNGYEYPIELVKDWFDGADLRHVSNEVSFMEGCEYTDAYTMQFCSKPDQIKVLENLGINVVESTGNHLNDYDDGISFASTLKMYAQRGWLNFGGGINAEAARQPATTEVNGNKIAFIGCNPVGFEKAWATDTKAGAAKCDYDWFYQQISDLKSQGYVVIATYQETEIDKEMYDEYYRKPFKEAASAGADIVQGSQAHVPMGLEFVGSSLIHYGLGNFLFDQMEPKNLREFYDRHVIYDGKYIGTQLLTATLTDWSRPAPMNTKDRKAFLTEIFNASDMRIK